MLPWQGWLIAAFLLLLLELFGTGFFAFTLAIAALITTASAAGGVSTTGQWWIFSLSALVLAPLLKWLFRRYAPSRRASFLAGEGQQEGVIVQLPCGELRIQIEGDLFLVRHAQQQPLKVGERVIVRRFDGITAIID